MADWTCTSCGRRFARTNQTHVCAPATTVDEWFAEEPATHREVHDRVEAHLIALGDVRTEAVAVGILYKRRRTLAELRPRADHLGLSIVLTPGRDHTRFSRRIPMSRSRTAYVVPVRSPDDIDQQVQDWLTEAWDLCS